MLPSPEFYERGRGESIDGVAKTPKYASTDFDGRPGDAKNARAALKRVAHAKPAS
jgi:hypothetical protein